MEKSLKGTKTEQNLINAFAGESQARNRYTFFASVAKKEGYQQISAIFAETADNEKEHAERFYKLLNNDSCLKVDGSYPVFLGSTLENLKHAAEGEHEEWYVLYKDAAEVAKAEGFDEIASVFKKISEVEEHHEARYLALYENIINGEVFEKDEPIAWKCRNCGYIHKSSKSAPKICPACAHPQGYFEVFCEKF